MDRQTLKDWVVRYNAHGLDGLYDCWGDGRPPRLEAHEQAELVRVVLLKAACRLLPARTLCAFAKPASARPSIRPRWGGC